MQDELEDLRDCGIGGCRPKILQALANIKVRVREKYLNEWEESGDRTRHRQGYAS